MVSDRLVMKNGWREWRSPGQRIGLAAPGEERRRHRPPTADAKGPRPRSVASKNRAISADHDEEMNDDETVCIFLSQNAEKPRKAAVADARGALRGS